MEASQYYAERAEGEKAKGPSLVRVREMAPERVSREAFLQSALPSMRRLLHDLRRLANHRQTFLLAGPTGVGKSWLAEYAHSLSERASRTCVVVNIASIAEQLASSELFGHVRGAFTGAVDSKRGKVVEADGGTLVLDEIGKASHEVQRQLLGFIETGTFQVLGQARTTHVDARVILTANEPLRRLVRQRRFLHDLYARLGSFTFVVPSLAEREQDLPNLIRVAILQRAPSWGYPSDATPALEPQLEEWLCSLPWRMNFRQMFGAVDRILFRAEGAPVLKRRHVDLELEASLTDTHTNPRGARALTEEWLRSLHAKTGGNVSAMATAAGVSRNTVYARIRKLGIDRSSLRSEQQVNAH